MYLVCLFYVLLFVYQLYLEKRWFNYTKCLILGCSRLKPDPAHVSRGRWWFGLRICEEPVKIFRVSVPVSPSADW